MESDAVKRPLEDDIMSAQPEDTIAEPPKKAARTINISKDAKGDNSGSVDTREDKKESWEIDDLPPPRVYLDPENFDTKNETSPIFVHHVDSAGKREIFPMFDAEEYVGSCIRTGTKFSIQTARKYDAAAKRELKRCYGCLYIEGWKTYWERQLQYIYEDLEYSANEGSRNCRRFLEKWKETPEFAAEAIFPHIETGGLGYAQTCAMDGTPFEESVARARDKAIKVEYEANDLPYWCYTCDYHQNCGLRAKKRYQAMSKAWEKYDDEHS